MNRHARLGRPPAARPLPPQLSRDQLRFHKRAAGVLNGNQFNWPIILITLAGISYNAALAFLNAHGSSVSLSLVITTEVLILVAAALIILAAGMQPRDGPPALLFTCFLVIALLISVFGDTWFIGMARNVAIIALFTMLGARLGSTGLQRCFFLASLIVGAVLLLEIISVDQYASVFQPGPYFDQTRGIGTAEYDESGLFAPALGFEGRFSIFTITGHRTASLFLEQVSLGNFAAVMSIFLVSKWQDIARWQRIFSIALITLILLTTNSRAGLAISLAAPVVYHVAPKLHRYTSLLVMPVVLLVAWAIANAIPSTGDDLPGRMGVTIENLSTLDLQSLAGLQALSADEFADSGYTYVIYASSILGLLGLWLFICTAVAGPGKERLRCSLLTSLYVFGNLSVSGTSIFSIKTAALLWLLVGHMWRDDPVKSAANSVPADTSPRTRPLANQRRRLASN
jgi:hypothetical protein